MFFVYCFDVDESATIMANEKRYNNFIGDPSWCSRFLKRNKLTMRTRTTIGQKLPNDWKEKKASFFKFVKEKVEKLSLNLSQIGSAYIFRHADLLFCQFYLVKSVPVVTYGNEKKIFHSCTFLHGFW